MLVRLLSRYVGAVEVDLIVEYDVPPVYVSIGADCSTATWLSRAGLRTFASPFDWIVSYGGISQTVADRFSKWSTILPPPTGPLLGEQRTNPYGCFFYHDDPTATADQAKYRRRIDRFYDLFDSGRSFVHLIRVSHKLIHHIQRSSIETDDVSDAVRLDNYLRSTYPNAGFRIWIILCCPRCFRNRGQSSTTNVCTINVTAGLIDSNADNYQLERTNTLAEAAFNKLRSGDFTIS